MRSLHDTDRPALTLGMTALKKIPHKSAEFSPPLLSTNIAHAILAKVTGDIQDEPHVVAPKRGLTFLKRECYGLHILGRRNRGNTPDVF